MSRWFYILEEYLEEESLLVPKNPTFLNVGVSVKLILKTNNFKLSLSKKN